MRFAIVGWVAKSPPRSNTEGGFSKKSWRTSVGTCGTSGLPEIFSNALISAIFLISGVEKVRAPAWTITYIASVGLPFAPLGLVIGIAVELVGGSALLLGYQSRSVAAVLVAYCVATAVFFHRDFKDQSQLMNFFKNIAMAGGLLQIIAFGAGSFSLDGTY